jgi:hypothetical protein
VKVIRAELVRGFGFPNVGSGDVLIAAENCQLEQGDHGITVTSAGRSWWIPNHLILRLEYEPKPQPAAAPQKTRQGTSQNAA